MRLSIWLVGIALLSGCTSFSGAPERRATLAAPTPLAPDAWPKRDRERLADLTRGTPAELYMFQLDGSRPADQMHPADVKLASAPIAKVESNEPVGQGVLRVFDDLAPQPGGSAGFPINARFVSSWYLDLPGRTEYQSKAAAFEQSGNRLLSVTRPGLRYSDRAARDLTAEGVGIGLPPPPLAAAAPRARGIVVHLNGSMSAAYERPLLETLESRGWAVIHVDTVAPTSGGDGTPIPVQDETQITDAAVTIASRVDQALAENAYAVEAALEYCATHRPDLPQRPVILLGCSTGALALPAVATRLRETVDAAILIGGGANILDISQRSEDTSLRAGGASGKGGISLDWGQSSTPVPAYTDLLVKYLTCSKLDPYHTAPHLVDRPVLVVHAVFDAVVPASAGLLLYDRLGEPDRLRFSGGHTAMFYFIEDNAPKIATWLDRAIQRRVRVQEAAARGVAPPPAPPEQPTPSLRDLLLR